MPFKKKEGKEFFMGMNLLKHYWTAIVKNINSTPTQQIEATKWLMFLCAETDLAKNVASFALMVHYGARVGYKMPESASTPSTPTDPLAGMVGDMIQDLFAQRENGV